VCVAEKLLATDHARNAARLVYAVNSLHLMHACLGKEDDPLDDRLVTAVNDAADDIAGDACLDTGTMMLTRWTSKAKHYSASQQARIDQPLLRGSFK
jgi:hypothetical protein